MIFSSKVFIILIIVIIICVGLYIILASGDNNNFYRLGDIVKNNKLDPGIKKLKNLTLKKYPKSIGAEYIRSTDKYNDFVTLNKIVTNMCKNLHTNDILAVHIRLGDVLCQNPIKTIIEELANKGKYITHSADYIAKYLNKYFRDTPKIIYYGNHTNRCVQETKNFIDEILRKTHNCKAVESSSSYSEADKHLCEMINAKQFLMTGSSGYTKLIENIRKERGKESLKIR